MAVENKILNSIREEEKAECKRKDQWNDEGLCYACERYGTCDYSPCKAYEARQRKIIEELRKMYNV